MPVSCWARTATVKITISLSAAQLRYVCITLLVLPSAHCSVLRWLCTEPVLMRLAPCSSQRVSVLTVLTVSAFPREAGVRARSTLTGACARFRAPVSSAGFRPSTNSVSSACRSPGVVLAGLAGRSPPGPQFPPVLAVEGVGDCPAQGLLSSCGDGVLSWFPWVQTRFCVCVVCRLNFPVACTRLVRLIALSPLSVSASAPQMCENAG